MPLLVLAAMLGIVGYGIANGGGFSARFARLVRQSSRPRVILAWAIGTFVSYGVTSVVAIALLGRDAAYADMPFELRLVAWRLGLSGTTDPETLRWFALSAGLGAAIGILLLLLLRLAGRTPIGLRYRSPAAVRERGDVLAASALALAAGVSEELFFRLALPLVVAIVSGSGVIGIAIGWAAFVALHRHQGRVGMVAVGLIGGALTFLYLASGQLWLVICLHVAIDLNALVLRPIISGRGSARIAKS